MTHTFAYDGAGNPTTWQGQTRTFNSNNQETTGGNFGYNGDGSPWKYLNRNLKTTQNPNGTPQVLSYNTAGQLRQINAVNSDGTTGAVQYKYAYRGDGKRAWKEDANGNRTFFYYDGEAMLAYSGEADFSARLVLWGPDGVVGQQWRNSNNTTGSQYFLYDGQGNLAQTVGGDGAVSGSTYAFTAWGESVKNADGSQNVPGSFGYGAQFGYFRDGETGFYLCTYRHYDPSAGRWITRDPIRYLGGPNLYGYAWNDPAGLTDPSGLDTPPSLPEKVIATKGNLSLEQHYGLGGNEHGPAHAHVYDRGNLVGKVDAQGRQVGEMQLPRNAKNFVSENSSVLNKSLKRCGRWLQSQPGPAGSMGPGRRFTTTGLNRPKGPRWVGGRLGGLNSLFLGLTFVDIFLHPQDYDFFNPTFYYNPATDKYEHPLTGQPILNDPRDVQRRGFA